VTFTGTRISELSWEGPASGPSPGGRPYFAWVIACLINRPAAALSMPDFPDTRASFSYLLISWRTTYSDSPLQHLKVSQSIVLRGPMYIFLGTSNKELIERTNSETTGCNLGSIPLDLR
jgi:hypothetical protein